MFIPDKIFDDKWTKEIIEYDPDFSVKDFVTFKGGGLATYLINGMTGTDLIENICYNYKFSQRLVLLTLQREFSGVTRKDIDQAWLDKAFGVGCADNGDGGSTKTKYIGFETQVKSAIDTYKRWYSSARVGEPMKVDFKRFTFKTDDGKAEIKKWVSCNTVIPQNAVTFMFYKYTPHIGDRRSPFWEKLNNHGAYLTYLLGKKYFNWD